MGVYSVLGLKPRASLMLDKHCQVSSIASFHFVNIYLFLWGDVHHGMHLEVKRTAWESWFSPPTKWVLGIKFKSSSFLGSAFPC